MLSLRHLLVLLSYCMIATLPAQVSLTFKRSADCGGANYGNPAAGSRPDYLSLYPRYVLEDPAGDYRPSCNEPFTGLRYYRIDLLNEAGGTLLRRTGSGTTPLPTAGCFNGPLELGPGQDLRPGARFWVGRFRNNGTRICERSVRVNRINRLLTDPIKAPIPVGVSTNKMVGIEVSWEEGTWLPNNDYQYIIYRGNQNTPYDTIPGGNGLRTYVDSVGPDFVATYFVSTYTDKFGGHESARVRIGQGRSFPLGFRADSGGVNQVTLSWNRLVGQSGPDESIRSMNVYREGEPRTRIGGDLVSTTGIADTEAIPGRPHRYDVEVLIDDGSPNGLLIRDRRFMSAVGYRRPNGVVAGRITTRDGFGIPGLEVCATTIADNALTPTPYPLRRCAATDGSGRYRIEEVYYDEEATVRVAPTSLVRQFDPATRDAILSLDASRVEEVDFIDTTTITITGTVTQAEGATICPQPGTTVTARSLGNGRETTATTQPDGTYVITLEEPGAYTVTPRYENHAFAPTNVTRSFLQRLDTLNFRDEQRHTFSGKFRGSCDTYLGVARLLLYDGEDPASSCFVTSVLSAPETGDFSVELPARTYTVEVDSFAPAPDIALDPTEVVAAFAAGTEVDLDTADVNRNLTFRSPISVAIDVPEDYFLCDQERYPHPVFGQYTLVPLTFRVEESFRDQSCPVDTGLLRITDRIGDVDSTILLPFVNGRAEYQSFIGDPNIVGDEEDPFGGFRKTLEATAVVGNAEATARTEALVVGSRPREGTGVTVTPEIPFLILRDPPGDRSYSYLIEETATERSMQFHGDPLSRLKAKTGLYFGAKILDKIVPGARNVLPNSVREQIPQNFGDIFRVSATNNDFQELKWTFTETNTFRTSADPELTGSAGDLYVGHAMNMAYALTDIVEFDEETCAIDTLTDIIFAPESLETQFIYSEEFIRKSLIRDLEGQKQLFVRRYDQDTTQSGLIDSIAFFHTQAQLWRDVLAQNELLKQTTPTDRNITFDAGAGEFENKVRIDTVQNFTLKFLLNLDKSIVDERSMSSFLTVGPPVPPGSPVQSGTTVSRGIKLTNQYSISATIGSSSNLTERFTQETGYVLNDDDADGRKDFFSVNIGKDQKFGTPVFSLVLGRSSCPYEAGTQPRDQARLRAEATTLTNVTEDFAEFSLFLDNISQSDERRSYVLEALNEFNTEAAAIEIGGIRQIEEVYELAPRQGLPVKVRLYRSGNACSYPNIPFVLRAECGNDGAAVTPAGNTIVLSDTILLSAFFNCNCGSANLDLPEDNWRLNGTDGDRLLVKLSEYNPALIQRIDLQYTERGTSAWREGPRWTAEDLANAPVSLTDNWVLPTDIADGAYSLRLRILCNEDGYSYSEVRHGTIDRVEPLLSGYPEPADEILEAGDRIAARFNEPIDCDLLGESPVTLTDQQGNVIAENVSIGCQGNTVILAADAALSRLGDTLTASMKDVSDLAGNVKREPVNWRFVVLAEENESDPDLDQIVSSSDNCPLTANADQRDRDGDGIGDACDDDRDGDGIPNASDTCPNIANPDQSPICETSEDPDEDGIPDAEDNCPDLANATQQDLDNDGIGDICDDDRDGDGIPNALDGCPDLNDPTNPASTQCTVSADEQRINDPLPRLKIFPNPATDEVSVRLPVGASFRTFQIFDATGRRVRSLPLPAVITAPFTCDLVGLPSGTYRLQAVGREVSVNGSLIVVPRQ